jgi:hypothetical protein
VSVKEIMPQGRIWCIARTHALGDEKVPDAKTLARLGQVIGPEVIGELHERLLELACERGVLQGRKMRVVTTVVETKDRRAVDRNRFRC